MKKDLVMSFARHLTLFILISLSTHLFVFGAGTYTVVHPPPFTMLPIVAGMSQPGKIVFAPGDSSRMYVTERLGRVRVIRNDSLLASPLVDISEKIRIFDNCWGVNDEARLGLLDVAFPPDFLDSGHFYVLYFAKTDSSLAIDRYSITSNPDSADAASGTRVLHIPIPSGTVSFFTCTDECSMIFGLDSLLYITVADYDPLWYPVNRGPQSHLSHLLRIDVRSLPYSVPLTNPYVNSPDTLPEILSMDAISSNNAITMDRLNGDIYFDSGNLDSWWSFNFFHKLEQNESVLDTVLVTANGWQWPYPPSNGLVIYRGVALPWFSGRMLANMTDGLISMGDSFESTLNSPGAHAHFPAFSISTNPDQKTFANHQALRGSLFEDARGEMVAIHRDTIFRVVPLDCCPVTTGNVDCSPDDGVDIADLTVFVDHLFGSFPPICCPEQGNVDGVGSVDVGDLTRLVDYLFISFQPTASCP